MIGNNFEAATLPFSHLAGVVSTLRCHLTRIGNSIVEIRPTFHVSYYPNMHCSRSLLTTVTVSVRTL